MWPWKSRSLWRKEKPRVPRTRAEPLLRPRPLWTSTRPFQKQRRTSSLRTCYELSKRPWTRHKQQAVKQAPFPQHLDIFAQFPFAYPAVADGAQNAMEGRNCYASVHRMHIWTASIETPAVQWMFRIRMALAYHDSEEVRAYLEFTKGWRDMLSSAV